MMRNTFSARLLLLCVLGSGCFAAIAKASEPPPVVLVNAGHNLLRWTSSVEPESTTLTLADPQGRMTTFRFDLGVTPALSLLNDRGMPLPDGTYTWEIRVTPRPGADRELTPPRQVVQSGSFSINDGNLVDPDVPESAEAQQSSEIRSTAAPDQMVPDDLIVDGKGCIGLGCVNNEAFGVEALRLKQSVVRLRFQDTSTNPSFPTNDWQITVNDSASGGANRFSIEDIDGGKTPLTIRAGAPDHTLYVDNTGRIGLGTSTPTQRLHILGSNGATQALIEETNGTATPRLLLQLTNNGGVRFNLVDTSLAATWGTNLINGNYKIQKGGAGVTTFELQGTGNLTRNSWSDNVSDGNYKLIKSGFAVNAFDLQGNGNLTIAGVLTQNSDRTTKTDIEPVDPQAVLAKMANVPISIWRKIDDTSTHLGPMAQDFHAVFGLGEDERHIAPGDLAGVSLAAIQGLHALVEEQRELIDKQQEVIGKLEERLRRLEAQEQSDPKVAVQP